MNRFVSLGQLAPEAFAPESEGLLVTGICSDSRNIQPGNLFVALKGYQRPGTDFIQDAVRSGATAVISDVPDIKKMDVGVPYALDVNLAANLSQMAGEFYRHPSQSMKITGITGTNGKTSCCYWLSWLLNSLGVTSGQVGTLGAGMPGSDSIAATGFTTPDAIQVQKLLYDCAHAKADAVVMEVSSHGLDQGRVAAVHFESAIFTNLTQDHLDYHTDMESYLQAKLRLFQMPGLKHAVFNLDDAVFERIKSVLAQTVTGYSYSLKNADADLYFSEIQALASGFKVRFAGNWGQQDAHLPVLGEYNLSNILAVVLCLLAKGDSLRIIASLLERLPQVPGRMQQVRVEQAPLAVVDYAHTPDAVRSALDTLQLQCEGQLIAVLGCGGGRDKSKRPLMAEIAVQHSTRQIFTSDNPRDESPAQILDDMTANLGGVNSFQVVEDRGEAIRRAINSAGFSDLIAVLGKGHEGFQEIKGKKQPFSDIEVCQQLLQQRVSATKQEIAQ